jgi:tripartite-type tricarboxylate transporter receptor subunit TctC
MKTSMLGGLAAVLIAVASPPAAAETYPNRPMRLVVPYAPGGVTDYTGRLLAKTLGDAMGQQMVVDNRPGAGGMIGTELVAHAPPDGYTVLLMDSAIAVIPSLQKSMPFDVLKDLQPISLISSSPLLATVNPASPAHDIRGLIDYAKTKPGGLNYGSAGIATAPHMAGELFRLETGAPLTHVAYKGMGPAVTDLLAGQIDLCFGSVTATLPFVTDGKLRALATTTAKRSPVLPNLPSVAEAGVPGFDVDIWLVLLAPAGMPRPLIDRLNQEMRSALANPQLIEGFAKVGAEPRFTAPEETGTFLAAELKKWLGIVRAAKIELN